MYTPDEDDYTIHKAAALGELELLHEMEVKIGDADDFRRRCEFCRDYFGLTGLHFAAAKGFIHICKFLIHKIKVDINIKTDIGDSPLLVAVKSKRISTAKYLINRGADITIANSKGMTPLHYAAEQGNEELMEILLSKGADIESNSVNGTPLQYAASLENLDSVRLLLEHGANPNPVSLLSPSPLFYAIYSPSHEFLELLLKAGANPNMNSCGASPLSCAAMIGVPRVVTSLLAAGANPNLVSILSENGNEEYKGCLKPIEQAVSMGRLDVVRILFPLTERIPVYPDWTIRGIINYFHYEAVEIKREQNKEDYLRFVDQKGKDAVKRKDYATAVKWFSEGIYVDPNNARLKSNRSICWANLNEPAFALYDAEECVKLRPDWIKSHYREGVAWMLLKSYVMACRAFFRAKVLEPENEEIEKAFGEAVVAASREICSQTYRWRTP
ncbi:hypothetical protein ABFS82_04G036900 [Erythranthe guttata]